jgi:hypothetical protein
VISPALPTTCSGGRRRSRRAGCAGQSSSSRSSTGSLAKSGVDFVAADFPQANRLTVHILAVGEEDHGRVAHGDNGRIAFARLSKAYRLDIGYRWLTAALHSELFHEPAGAGRGAMHGSGQPEASAHGGRSRAENSFCAIADGGPVSASTSASNGSGDPGYGVVGGVRLKFGIFLYFGLALTEVLRTVSLVRGALPTRRANR